MVFVVLAIITITHVIFSLLTNISAMPFFHVVRPLMYVGLWLLLLMVGGRVNRPVYKGQYAVLAVGFGVAVYITVFILLGIFFGFARNMMMPSTGMIRNNFILFAPFAVCSEILRYRLIRDAKVNKNTIMIALVTVVFIFSQITAISGVGMFFSIIAPIIVLNVVLSYIAIDGKLAALIILRGVFDLTPVLIPVLPNLRSEVWALFLQMILFIVFLIYRMFMQETERKRREVKESFLQRFAAPAVILAILMVFNLGLLPVFPSVVITGSMAGSLDVGSVALIRRTFDEITEGDIIQFESGRNMMVIHRVVEVRTDMFGAPYFITKGDANDRPDTSPVTLEQVTGVVFGSFRHVGMPRVWVNQLFR